MSSVDGGIDPESILTKCSKDYLIELLAVFSNTDAQTVKRTFRNRDKGDIVRALTTAYNGRATLFATHLNEIRSCSLGSLKELLIDEDGISIGSIEDIHDKKDWLLFAYRQGLQDRIRTFVIRSQISPTSLSKEYIVEGRLRNVTAEQLTRSIHGNMTRFNERSLRKFFWRFPPTFAEAGDSRVFNITVFVEGKEQTVRTFKFRNNPEISEEERYEVETTRFHSVGKKSISLIIKDGKYLLNTNLNLDRDMEVLYAVLNPLFDGRYTINPVTYPAHAALVKTSRVESEDPSEATEHIIESFDELKELKIEEVKNDANITREKKEAMTSIIEQITFSGISTGDTPEYSVESFDWTFKNVESAMRLPGSREMAGALLSVSKNYTLKFNYKSTRIALENGRLKFSKTLPPHEDEAVRILFSGDNDGEN